VARSPGESLDLSLVRGIYDSPATSAGYGQMRFLDGLLDVEDRRLREMD
jgi:2,3-dihydroxybenzoate decarboxylase/5-carboxyvanillate decarboxylase